MPVDDPYIVSGAAGIVLRDRDESTVGGQIHVPIGSGFSGRFKLPAHSVPPAPLKIGASHLATTSALGAPASSLSLEVDERSFLRNIETATAIRGTKLHLIGDVERVSGYHQFLCVERLCEQRRGSVE